MIRKQKFRLIIFFLLIILFSIFIFAYFFNNGLNLKTNITNNKLNITIENNSLHIIKNIILNINNKETLKLNNLKPNSKKTIDLNLENKKYYIKLSANNYIPIEKEINATKGKTNNNDLFTYNLKYNSFMLETKTNITLRICNLQKQNFLNIDLEDNNSFIITKQHKEININTNECKNVIFEIKPFLKGNTNIIFEIYNNFYNKIINQKINISG